jgi:hypothetical protein
MLNPLKGLVHCIVIGGFVVGLTALAGPGPAMKNFVGVNGHFHFKPDLYRPTCQLVRNYHDINWDVEKPGDPLTLPQCPNGVRWDEHVYGPWSEAGFEISLCAQFGLFGPAHPDFKSLWEGQEEWIQEYGAALARTFPEHGVTSIEIGNEPGARFPDTLYFPLFRAMAKGIRAAAPEMKIVTPAVHPVASTKYEKGLDPYFREAEILPLYDVINLHVYPMKAKADQAHPWDRSYPEDPSIDYLKTVDQTIRWRDQHAPSKEIWITEFGYDSCTPEAMKTRTGWAKQLNWTGVTDTQQAQYLVRSLLCFASRDVARAYIYFYNDEDKASVHAASGLTRHFEPKPSYWAVKHFYRTLGDFRFEQIIKEEEGHLFIWQFVHAEERARKMWVTWSPTGSGREIEVELTDMPGPLLSAEVMPLEDGKAPTVDVQPGDSRLTIPVSESPLYLTWEMDLKK